MTKSERTFFKTQKITNDVLLATRNGFVSATPRKEIKKEIMPTYLR